MKPCLFSVSFAGLWGQARLALPDFITRAGRLGFPSVMLMGKRPHLSPLDATPEFVQCLKVALKKARVRCDVVAAYTHLAPGIAPEVPVLEFQIAYVETLARLAAGLGASVVRIFTAYESGGRDTDVHWSRTASTIREMCDRAAAHRVTIAIQNHHDLAVHTDAMLELVAEIDRPNCKLGFDAWSPAFRGEDLYEAARKAAPHTAITTNADYVRFPRYQYLPELTNYQRLAPDLARAVLFGTGSIDYPAFFKGLRDGGFEGLAVYEMCSPLRGGGTLKNLEACATTYLKWMRAQHFID
jgi:sugar phosphate isomerase/epimerase